MRWFASRSPWWLAISVAANLFFVALIASSLAFGPLAQPKGAPSVRWLVKRAGPDSRPAIEAAMAGREVEIEAAQASYDQTRKEYTAALTAPTVDPERLRQAIAARDASRQRMRAILNDIFVEVAPTLPEEVRKKMAEHRKRKRERRADDKK